MWGSVIGAGITFANSQFNDYQQKKMSEEARRQNFMYNEQAANNADKRFRAQYADLFSPSAQLKQLRDAGLSPALMYGGSGGSGGATAPIGAGPNGPAPNHYPTSALDMAQIENIIADTKQKESETKGTDLENTVKEMNLQWQQLESIFKTEKLRFLSTAINNNDNTFTSLAEYANNFETYEEFKNKLLGLKLDENTKNYILSVSGNEELQEVYSKARQFKSNLETIQGDLQYATYLKDLYTTLNTLGGGSQTANQMIAEIKKATEQANFDESQKKAINDMFNSIENENMRTIAILLYMVLDKVSTQTHANVTTSTTKITK